MSSTKPREAAMNGVECLLVQLDKLFTLDSVSSASAISRRNTTLTAPSALHHSNLSGRPCEHAVCSQVFSSTWLG